MRTVDDCDHNVNGKLDEADYQALSAQDEIQGAGGIDGDGWKMI